VTKNIIAQGTEEPSDTKKMYLSGKEAAQLAESGIAFDTESDNKKIDKAGIIGKGFKRGKRFGKKIKGSFERHSNGSRRIYKPRRKK
jgi:hypothetical protein